MAPPLPPPGVPPCWGLAPQPMAWLLRKTLLIIVHETPMLLIPPPLEQMPPSKVVLTTYTGRFWYWLNTRSPAPPTSGPVGSQRFPMNWLLNTLNLPPRTKMAPPPPPPSSPSAAPVELPPTNVRF